MNKIGTLKGKRDDWALEARAPLTVEEPPVEPPVEEPTTSTSTTKTSSDGGLGHAVISSIAGGAAGAAVGNLLNKIESLFRRDSNNEIYFNKRDVSSIASIITQAKSLSPADKTTVKTALVNKIGTLHARVNTVTEEPIVTEPVTTEEPTTPPTEEPSSSTSSTSNTVKAAAGGGLGSLVIGVAGKALGGLTKSETNKTVTGLLNEVESFFKREVYQTALPIEARDELVYTKRDASAIASIVSQAKNLSPADKATVKTALVNKIGKLQAAHPKRLSLGGAAGSALGGLASVGANHVVSGLLTDIENLFRRSDDFDINEL
ncbi:hypothetical protein DL93DRAFT_2083364, partial [Clavulina sp. PMI_390]